MAYPKRASLNAGIEWIATNDDPTELERATVAGQISVQLLADLFEKDATDLAQRIISYRMVEHRF